MYQGYRVKINGIIIENNMIIKGSYSTEKSRRVLSEYYDQKGIKHQELSPRETITINFTLKERNIKEQEIVMKALSVENYVEVEYWDDKKLQYELGYFKIETYKLEHKAASRTDIRYKDTPLILKEY